MTATTERAILAGGCFWGMQDLLRRYPGVISTRVGYRGGDVPNATYRIMELTLKRSKSCSILNRSVIESCWNSSSRFMIRLL